MKNISQKVTFSATPREVYGAFMDEKKHSEFTGSKTKIENKTGGKFEVWDGYAYGKNIELIENKKIVQAWRASDWPENIESKIVIQLEEKNGKTELKFSQVNVPDEFVDDVRQGWLDYYWKPLIDYFKK